MAEYIIPKAFLKCKNKNCYFNRSIHKILPIFLAKFTKQKRVFFKKSFFDMKSFKTLDFCYFVICGEKIVFF